jgi:outer membrane lipoprotein-sorting protein
MKKLCVILAISLVLPALVFCGCTQSNNEKSKFIGTWVTQEKTNPMDGSNYTDMVIFYQNGTYAATTLGIRNIPGTWSLQNGKLRINTYYPGTYEYAFSNNNTVLTLTPASGGATETLTKP